MSTTPTAPRPMRINPRIRERRIEVLREAGRKRLRVLLVVSSVLSAAGLVFLAVTSPLLDVDRIRVSGEQHVTAAQVRDAARVHAHDHLLFVDTGAAARRVESLPWVEHATVTRDFPGTVRIAVREYTPVAYVRAAHGVVLVAADGHVVAAVPSAPAGLVEVRGVRQVPAPGAALSPPDAAGVVSRLPRDFAQQVVAVDVRGSGLTLDVAGGGEIRLGDATELAAKVAAVQAVIAHLAGRHYSYIDVSTPDRPISHS